ncbi:MAG: Flp pilus assembly protein CpaB [Anaerolineae bacterium]
MKPTVLVTILLALSIVLTACDALPGGNGGVDPDPESSEEVPATDNNDPDATLIPGEPTEERVPVVIAVQNIPRGTVVTPDRVEVVLYPISAIPNDIFQEVDFVVGQIAATDIYINELLLSRKLVQGFDSLGSVGSDAAALLEPGRQMISVPIDRLTSVAYALQPGDRVDVIVSMLFVDLDQDLQTQLPNLMTIGNYFADIETDDDGQLVVTRNYAPPPYQPQFLEEYSFYADGFDSRTVISQDVVSATGFQTITVRDDMIQPVIIEPSEQQRPRLVTQRTITDAQVIYVGEFPRDGRIFVPTSTPVNTPEPDPNALEGETVDETVPTETPVPDRPTIISLAVRPQDAVTLTYFSEASIPMTFALRSARTQGLPDTTPVTLNYILQTYNIQVPERLNFGIEPAIRSIRGITLENIFASGSADASTNAGEEEAVEE